MDKTYKPITDLHEWDLNPRDIDEKSFNRLKDQLTLKGQFAPLLIMQDGIVLGGNMRLKALRELGFENIWVTVVSFTKKENGMWYAIFEGQEQSEPYNTMEDAMMSWSLAHNADYGRYDSDKFANLEPNYGLDWNQFAVNFDIPETIKDLMDAVAPEAEDKQFKHLVLIEVKTEDEQRELYVDMTNKGYNAKTKTTLAKQKNK